MLASRLFQSWAILRMMWKRSPGGELLQHNTVIIHEPVDTACQPRFRLGSHVGREMISPPCLITPDKFITSAALNHDRHNAAGSQLLRTLSQF
jgi:hypothetical protein